MGINKALKTVTLPVEKFIGTAYDVVKAVYDNLTAITTVNDNKTNIDINADNIVDIQNAEENAAATAADLVLTNADVVSTGQDVIAASVSAQEAASFAIKNVDDISELIAITTQVQGDPVSVAGLSI